MKYIGVYIDHRSVGSIPVYTTESVIDLYPGDMVKIIGRTASEDDVIYVIGERPVGYSCKDCPLCGDYYGNDICTVRKHVYSGSEPICHFMADKESRFITFTKLEDMLESL